MKNDVSVCTVERFVCKGKFGLNVLTTLSLRLGKLRERVIDSSVDLSWNADDCFGLVLPLITLKRRQLLIKC